MPLGIDVGGTFIKLFDGKRREKIRTPQGYTELLESLINIIGEEERVTVAVAGLVIEKEGIIEESPNLPFLRGKELRRDLERKSGARVRLVNDATAAAYGEFVEGSGRNSELFICLTLGTRLGGGAVINGKPLEGVKRVAMEVGHTTICLNGWPCHCGRRGCLEAYASSYGLERHYFLLTGKQKSSFEIIEEARKGKEGALGALKELSKYLSVGITNLLHTFNPDRLALSGGIVANFPEIVDWCKEEIERRSFKPTLSGFKLVNTELGEFSGAIGAFFFPY